MHPIYYVPRTFTRVAPLPARVPTRAQQLAAEQAKGPGWAERLARAGAPLTPKETSALLRASGVYPYGDPS